MKIQNGDLCEADQTRVLDDDDVEEEGAVGGILESPQSVECINKQVRYARFFSSPFRMS